MLNKKSTGDKVVKFLHNAESYCLFGLEPDNTIRDPEQSDMDAAKILAKLIAHLMEGS